VKASHHALRTRRSGDSVATRATLIRKQAAYRRTILRWFRKHGRDFPWRHRSDPYSVLISEVLLQRTRGEHAVRVYRELLRRWPRPRDLARARHATIARVIRPLGLAKRADILKRLGKALDGKGGEIPHDPEQLIKLPGVGPYAAHSVPVFSFNRNLPVVDWVIARVLRRYFGLSGNRRPNADPDLWELATRLASKGNARALWLGTLDLGAAICKTRPRCPECPLRASCSYPADRFDDVTLAP
jgi:A/G-specific adenine glycosylase